MSRALVLAALVSGSIGCLGYRSQPAPAAPTSPPPTYAPPPPTATQPPPPGGATQPPIDPATAMLGPAWTLYGMLTQGMPLPSLPAPAGLPWPWPFPLPVMTDAPPVPGIPGPPPPLPTGDVPAAWARFEDEVIALTNRRRAEGALCGGRPFAPVPPLALDMRLRQAARWHATDMATRGYFGHSSPEGTGPTQRTRQAGFPSSFVGENIAAGYETPDEVLAGWMKSPGHCSNIMDPRYTLIGVGYDAAKNASQHHDWVQDFGAL